MLTNKKKMSILKVYFFLTKQPLAKGGFLLQNRSRL